MDFFIDLIIGEMSRFYIKLLVIPTSVLLALYFVYVIWLKVEKSEMSFIVHSKLILLKSISLTIVLFNIYWVFLIKANGIFLFAWNNFSFNRNSIYVMLLPVLLGYISLIYLYFTTQNKIKNLL
jgi:hypothetical protein